MIAYKLEKKDGWIFVTEKTLDSRNCIKGLGYAILSADFKAKQIKIKELREPNAQEMIDGLEQ